jgi:hypothetical protein
MTSPFVQVAPTLHENGYSPIPIMPGNKAPGFWTGKDWRPMKDWDAFCRVHTPQNAVSSWAKWPDAGVGIACGRGLICIDIDHEEIVEPLMAILPIAYVQKKGRKGVSLFYQGNTEIIRSKNYRTPERVGLVDLLAEGKQTVLPPSIHPDTGEPYRWVSDETLLDVGTAALAILPDNVAEQIGEVLRAFGYDPDGDRAAVEPSVGKPYNAASPASGFRSLNDAALSNLERWVPDLYLMRCRAKADGFEAVAHWRKSGTGRATEQRKRNLSITRKGIVDFGSGDTFTPIDLTMTARDCDLNVAVNWLLERMPREPIIFNGRTY